MGAKVAQLLATLGMASVEQARVLDYLQSSGFEPAGAEVRLQQLSRGVDRRFIDRSSACRLLSEQPQLLRLGFATVYEDERLVCVDKPHDVMLRLSGPEDGEPSVHAWLCANHPSVVTAEGNTRICHNLDFATSGVLVCAKHAAAAREVGHLFESRRARKLYAALVFGHPEWETREINARIAVTKKKFRQSITKSKVGKESKTTAIVAARGKLLLAPYAERSATLVWLMPSTGRRHQLRLHMAHIGHPIVGDFTYANDMLAYRMFLHAAILELPLQSSQVATGSDSTVRGVSPLAPQGWAESFVPQEMVRSPQLWPDAASLLVPQLCERT
ncbi:hypothetical protein AB1Y20_007470 [Prymnesium parvum]|uniref:Pseudouridine synthase RsuA/RluA-like domain-containing protein n=1 Tax=Prymnesium parvum TaxID=97485 RepID=A0AB34IV28_PRYPA